MLIRRHKVSRVQANPLAPSNESIEDSSPETNAYTKTDISRMSLDNLKSLATELGIEVTEESTGNKLKPAIIEKLGL